MPDKPLEQRVGQLEKQMRDVLERLLARPQRTDGRKDWRQSLGMFDDNPLMPEIDAEGERIRQADRERASNDSP